MGLFNWCLSGGTWRWSKSPRQIGQEFYEMETGEVCMCLGVNVSFNCSKWKVKSHSGFHASCLTLWVQVPPGNCPNSFAKSCLETQQFPRLVWPQLGEGRTEEQRKTSNTEKLGSVSAFHCALFTLAAPALHGGSVLLRACAQLFPLSPRGFEPAPWLPVSTLT